jgi:hypothetical protein
MVSGSAGLASSHQEIVKTATFIISHYAKARSHHRAP